MPTFAKDRQHFNIAVFVLVRNDAGEYLLQQRQNTSYMNGAWDFSGSGHLERGETIKRCAIREIEEESGLVVDESSLKLAQVLQHDVGDWPYIDFLFVASAHSGDLATQEPDKIANLQWFSPDAFPERLTLALHSYRNAGFPVDELTFAYVDENDHATITGEAYEGV